MWIGSLSCFATCSTLALLLVQTGLAESNTGGRYCALCPTPRATSDSTHYGSM
jgi:hypothetical protein